jgi:quercetin dioxygenase-like cupin family protein
MKAGNRRYYNPIQQNYAVFLKTSEETNGELTLIEIELAPYGGGLPPHYHPAFTEEFEVIKGQFSIQIGNEHKLLKTGDTALVPINTPHRIYSTSDEPAKFLAELRPGNTGFENALKIAYGLAEDGKINKLGVPKNILELAVIFEMTQGSYIPAYIPPGLLALIRPVFRLLANIARKRGVEKRLKEEYL